MRKPNRIYITGCILTLLFLFNTGTAWARSAVLKNWRGLAVKGYDVVAYFNLGLPVKGDKAFQYQWQNATWRFTNAEHLAAFKAEPERYAPQYGGY